MADNVAITAGSGTTVAADEVADGTLGTVKVQFVKLMDGTLDGTQKAKVLAASTAPVATDPALVVAISPNSVNANGQAVAANSAPTVPASDWQPSWVFAEDTASANLDKGVQILAILKATPADTAGTDGDYQPIQMKNGMLWVNTSAGATSFAKLEDAASADGDAGVPAMMRRTLAPINTSGTDGDYEIIQGTGGRLWVDPCTKFINAATSGAITRPANQTAYSALDAVSNNATAGSVTTNTFAMSAINDDPITIEEILMFSTDTGVGGKTLRIYLYNSDPTANSGVGGGDNAAWSQKQAGFIGTMVGTMIAASDGSHGRFVPEAGSRIVAVPTSGAKTIYWMLQTLEAWTPSANSTTFTPTAKGFQGHA